MNSSSANGVIPGLSLEPERLKNSSEVPYFPKKVAENALKKSRKTRLFPWLTHSAGLTGGTVNASYGSHSSRVHAGRLTLTP